MTVGLLSSSLLQAQQIYPVQVNTIIIPPYSPYTSDYVNSVNDKLIVNLLLRDLEASNVQVRLRVNIEGQGVSLRTNPTANIPIITLDGGIPERLSGTDLAPYFNADNLILNGITAAKYRQKGGQLPEGFYRVCFDVYEVKTGAKLSVASGCANAWIVMNDPPLINFPANNANVAVNDPQYVTFQWTPRHKGSPNSAFSTEYVFQLVELLPGFNSNPQAAFLATTPLYETTTSNTMLVYGPSEPPLTAGRTYVFRVQAKSMVNGEEMDLFKNNGYSEIYSFIYLGTCKTPTGLTATTKGSSRLEISWLGGTPDQEVFELSYRKANVADASWFNQTVNGNKYTLSGLLANTAYEFKVRANCSDGAQSSFTPSQQTTTAAGDTTTYKCGVIPAAIAITNQSPLESMKAGDEFKAGDFDINVTKVEGSKGRFTGVGYVVVPYLNDAKIGVSFSNVLINTDYQLAEGQVITQYDATWSGINDLDKYFEGGGTTGAVVTGKDSADITVPVVINKPEDIKVTPHDSTGVTLTITGSNGETITKEVANVPVTVKDAAGNVYSVTKDGDDYKVTQIAKGGTNQGLPAASQLNQLHADKAVVRFTSHPAQVYAFDAWNPVYSNSLLFGAEYQKLANDYYVPAKATVAGKPDVITAEISIKDKSINPDSIYFITGKGTVFTSYKNADSSTYTVNIVGGGSNDAQELYAVYLPAGSQTPITLGKVLIASYQALERKLVLVPVNGEMPDADELEQKLNSIYDSVGVHWTVVTDEPFTDESLWDSDNDHLLNVTGSGVFSTETAEMKALHAAYASARGVNAQSVYLFVLKGGTGAESQVLRGDMPRAKQYGYIFTDRNNDVAATVAHEVGHGVFHLKHTFDGFGFTDSDLKDNVMNYHDGTRFTKMQWDAIHDPAIVWGVFEKDGDAAQAIVTDMTALKKFVNPDGTYTFLSLAGKPLTIKGKLSMVSFSTSTDIWLSDNSDVPLGALVAFQVNDKYYNAVKSGANKSFNGYLDSLDKKTFYLDSVSILKKYINVLVGIPCLNNGAPVFKVFPTNYLTANDNMAKVDKYNKGDGTLKDIFFLSEYLNGVDAAIEVFADMPALTQNEILFLSTCGIEGNLCGENALYAYKAASLIRKMPNMINCVTDAQSAANLQVDADNRSLYTQPDATYVAKTYVETAIMKQEYERRHKESKGFYKYLYQTLNIYYNSIQNKSLELKDQTDVDNVVDMLDGNNVRGRSCVIKCMPLNLRTSLLHLHTQRTWTNSKESLMADLVEMTPDDQMSGLLDELEGKDKKYELLRTLFNDINGGDIDRLIGRVSNSLTKLKPNTNSNILKWPEKVDDAPTDATAFIGVIKITANDVDGLKAFTKADMNESTGQITFTYYNKSDPLHHGKEHTTKYACGPYDYVHLRFMDDYRFAKLGANEKITQGSEIVVPAIWAYWLIQRQETIENWNSVRIGVNVGAVILSVATMEPGPLLAAEVLFNGIDIGFTLAEDDIASHGTDTQKHYSELWNQIYMLYGGVMISKVLVVNVAPRVIQTVTRYTINTTQLLGDVAGSLTKTVKSAADLEAALDRFLVLLSSTTELSAAGRNLFYSTVLAWKLNMSVLKFAKLIPGTELLVSQGAKVSMQVPKGFAQQVATAALKDGDIVLQDISWYSASAHGEVESVVSTFKNIKYESAAGKAPIVGDLEAVKTVGGSIVMRVVNNEARYALRQAFNIGEDLAALLSDNEAFMKLFNGESMLIKALKDSRLTGESVIIKGVKTDLRDALLNVIGKNNYAEQIEGMFTKANQLAKAPFETKPFVAIREEYKKFFALFSNKKGFTVAGSDKTFFKMFYRAMDRYDLVAIEKEFGPDAVKLVNELQEMSISEMAALDKATRGPVLSGVLNPATGKRYFGINLTAEELGRFGIIPGDGQVLLNNTKFITEWVDKLHPVLQKRVMDFLKKLAENPSMIDLTAGIPGTHAEIRALDQALKEIPGATDATLKELILHNRSLAPETGPLGFPPRCNYCNPLTTDVIIILHN
ncbi:YwqJ-like deaminase [Chitinophaga sp. CF118]|nr:YwqJ-like deaminase [Chitinophaga sp. CF118]